MHNSRGVGKPPRYLRHASRNRGFSYFRDSSGARRQRYFPGDYESSESRRAYLEFLQEWESRATAGTRPRAKGPYTVGEIAAAFLDHADRYYRKNGEATGETYQFELALAPVVTHFGDVLASEFGPKSLRAVRDVLERGGKLARRTVNARVSKVRQVFRWATEEELVPGETYQALRALKALQHGRSVAAERDPVEPVSDEHVEAVMPFLTPTLRAMVTFARFTGARPQEVCQLTPNQIDRSDPEAWLYWVKDHKNYHRGHKRPVGIGPRVQSALKGRLDCPQDCAVFSPERSERERRALRRGRRKTSRTPSQRARDQARADAPKRVIGDRWTVAAFRRRIHRACDRAGIPRWSPNQLRHSFENRVEQVFGLETTSRAMGHSSVATTEHYRSKRKEAAARAVAKHMG